MNSTEFNEKCKNNRPMQGSEVLNGIESLGDDIRIQGDSIQVLEDNIRSQSNNIQRLGNDIRSLEYDQEYSRSEIEFLSKKIQDQERRTDRIIRFITIASWILVALSIVSLFTGCGSQPVNRITMQVQQEEGMWKLQYISQSGHVYKFYTEDVTIRGDDVHFYCDDKEYYITQNGAVVIERQIN